MARFTSASSRLASSAAEARVDGGRRRTSTCSGELGGGAAGQRARRGSPSAASSRPPVRRGETPAWPWRAAKVSGPLVRTVRSRAAPRSLARRRTVEEASNATAPVVGRRSASLAAIRALARGAAWRRWSKGWGPTALAPPRTRRATPRSSSSARSRRMVMSLTASSAAASAIVTWPSAAEALVQPREPVLGGEAWSCRLTSMFDHVSLCIVRTSRRGGSRTMSTISTITADLERQAIELPSWAFGNSGTRFKVFAQPGVPRDPFEKVADAAQVHELTGLAPSVALHIPWDRVDDFDKLRGPRRGPRRPPRHDQHEHVPGRRLQARQPLPRRRADPAEGHPARPRLRRHHGRDRQPGPQGLAARRPQLPGPGRPAGPPGAAGRLAAAGLRPPRRRTSAWCSSTSSSSPPSTPPTCPTGARRTCTASRSASGRSCASTPATTRRARTSSSSSCSCCGSAGSAPSTSTPASTPTTTSSSAPPTRSSCSASCSRSCGAAATTRAASVSFMLDQCHNIEAKIPGQIRSVLNVQEMTARALLVDRTALAEAERAGDVLAGNAVLMDAFYTDVRADLAEWRAVAGLAADPIGGLPGAAGTPSGSWPSGSAATRRAGGRDRRRRAARPVEPPRGRPPEHQLRRRQHVGQGHRGRPGDRRRRRAAVGEGLRRRPRHAHRADGLAVLRLDRLRALVDVYPGEEREDEMVAAFDFCRHGHGGAAPSIDTAMHGLVDAAHVDHLHPDSGIAIATAADGEQLTKDIFGDKVVWVPWRRPGLPARPRHRRRAATPTRRRSA